MWIDRKPALCVAFQFSIRILAGWGVLLRIGCRLISAEVIRPALNGLLKWALGRCIRLVGIGSDD